MVIFANFLSKNTITFEKKLSKMTMVSLKYASWHSIQEWDSVGADTIVVF